MKLCDGYPGKQYSVSEISLPQNLAKRLEVLGMTYGTQINIINKKGKGILIISVRGTRLALGENITRNITVREDLS